LDIISLIKHTTADIDQSIYGKLGPNLNKIATEMFLPEYVSTKSPFKHIKSLKRLKKEKEYFWGVKHEYLNKNRERHGKQYYYVQVL